MQRHRAIAHQRRHIYIYIYIYIYCAMLMSYDWLHMTPLLHLRWTSTMHSTMQCYAPCNAMCCVESQVTMPPEYAKAHRELQEAQRVVNEKKKLVQAQRQGAIADRSRYANVPLCGVQQVGSVGGESCRPLAVRATAFTNASRTLLLRIIANCMLSISAHHYRYVSEQMEYERSRIPLLEQEVAKAKQEVEAQTVEVRGNTRVQSLDRALTRCLTPAEAHE